MEFRSFPATTLLGDLTVISNFRRKNHFKRFDSRKAALAKLKTADPILDGEIVCLDGEGRSQPQDTNFSLIRTIHRPIRTAAVPC